MTDEFSVYAVMPLMIVVDVAWMMDFISILLQ